MRGAHFFNNRGGRLFRTVAPRDLLGAANQTTYHRMLRSSLGEDALAALKARYAPCSADADACERAAS